MSARHPRTRIHGRLLTGAALILGLGLGTGPPCADAQEIFTDSTLQVDGTPDRGLIRASDAWLGAVVVGSFALIPSLDDFDESLSRELSADLSERNTVPRIGGRTLGAFPVTAGLAAGTYLSGLVIGDAPLKRAGLHALESVALAAGMTRVIKIGVGRARPDVSSDADAFLAFNLDPDYHSFPSGHAAQMFALATSLSHDLADREPWVPFVVYPLAGLTATSRIQDRRHWATDVLAGAAVGIFSANLVQRLNGREGESNGLSWQVFSAPDGGIGIGVRAPLP